MLKKVLFLGVVLALTISSACRRAEVDPPIIIHVLHDPSGPSAKNLRSADLQFDLTKPHLDNGRAIMIVTNADGFSVLSQRLTDRGEELLVLNSQKYVPDVAAVRDHVGKPQLICGGASAYVPDWVSGDEREATETYLRFLVAHCDGGT